MTPAKRTPIFAVLLVLITTLLLISPVAASQPDRVFDMSGLMRGLAEMPANVLATDPYVSLAKTAQPLPGCRTYEVTLSITGKPPVKPLDVILVIDTSSSMREGSPTSLSYAKEAATSFAEQVLGGGNPNRNQVAVVSYSDNATTPQTLTGTLSEVTSAIDKLSTGTYTNIAAGFHAARSEMDSSRARADSAKAIVLLSDGVANRGSGNCTAWPTQHTDCTEAAIAAGKKAQSSKKGSVLVFTVGLLGSVNKDHRTSLWVARDTLQQAKNGGYYETFSGADLTAIYGEIAQQLLPAATDAVVTDEVSAGFEIVPGSLNTGRGSATASGQTITWQVGTVGSETVTLKYQVTAKAGYSGNLQVNDSATLSYKNYAGSANQLTFPVPSVNVPTELVVDAGPDQTISQGSSVQIGGNPTAAGGTTPYTYNWSPSTGLSDATVANPSASPSATTTYEVTVTCGDGCVGKDSVVVTVVTNRPPTVQNDVTDTCAGVPVSIDVLANDNDPDTGDTLNPASIIVTAAPAHGSTSVDTTNGRITYAPSSATWAGSDTFKYTVADNHGAKSSEATVTVTVHGKPTVSVSPTGAELTCAVQSIDLVATASPAASYTYQWYKGSVADANKLTTGTSLTVSEAGTYLVVATNSTTGCFDTASATVDDTRSLHIAVAAPSGPVPCNGSIQLTAIITGATEACTVQWFRVGTSGSIGSGLALSPVTIAGTYYAVASDGSCTAESNRVEVAQSGAPSATIAASDDGQLSCEVESIQLTANPAPSQRAYTYQWYKGSVAAGNEAGTSQSITVSEAGIYHVIVTDSATGCASEPATFEVTGGCTPETPTPVTPTPVTPTPVTPTPATPTPPPPPPCTHAVVVVRIYGAGGGLPVKCWVGGTEQPTQTAGIDSSGVAAAHWNFEVPAGETWSVRLEPQLGGLDPARWSFNSSGATLSIRGCQDGEASFQLIDRGEPGEPTPVPLLPVTGTEAAQAGLSWWQQLIQWLAGLLGALRLR